MLTKDALSGVVRLVNPMEHAGWDALLAQHGEPRFFHGSAWAKVLSDSYGYIPSYFTLSVEDRLQAMLPLMEIRSWLTGARAVSLPFTDEYDHGHHRGGLPAAFASGHRPGQRTKMEIP